MYPAFSIDVIGTDTDRQFKSGEGRLGHRRRYYSRLIWQTRFSQVALATIPHIHRINHLGDCLHRAHSVSVILMPLADYFHPFQRLDYLSTALCLPRDVPLPLLNPTSCLRVCGYCGAGQKGARGISGRCQACSMFLIAVAPETYFFDSFVIGLLATDRSSKGYSAMEGGRRFE